MRFLYPLGLIGLVGVPILLLIYILRSKYNEQTVASTYLWTLSERFFKRRNPLSGITGLISLILQILAVVILSLAISRPIFTIPKSATEYCFVLDDSGSMNSDNGLKSSFEKGKDQIKKIIKRSRIGSKYTLILTSDEGYVVYERVGDKTLALNMLKELTCTDMPLEADDALEKAQDYFDENTSTLTYLITDKAYLRSENAEIVNVGLQNAVNYAITDLEGVVTNGVLSASGSVISYNGDADLRVELYINGASSPIDSVNVSVEAGKSTRVELSHRVESYDSFKLVIANHDAYADDNQAISYNIKSDKSYNILLVSDTPFFLQAALDAVTDSVIDVISTDEYAAQSGYGLYIFHSFTPETLPDAAVWLINSSKSVADSGFGIRGVVELSQPEKIVKSTSTSSKVRKMLGGVDGSSIYISKYIKYSGMYTQFTTLFSYDGNPLIFAGVNALGNREVVFGFDLHDSDIIFLDFVPLILNLLEYSCPDVLDSGYFYCGDEAEVNITANVESVKAISPDGEEIFVDSSTDVGVIRLEQIGTYTVKIQTPAGEMLHKIYSAASISESDPSDVGEDFSIMGVMTNERTDGEYDPLVVFFVLLAIIFTADWMVYCYEKYQLR